MYDQKINHQYYLDKLMILDVGLLVNHISSDHRVQDDDIDEIIRYTYIEYLRELHLTPYLYRYQGYDIDDFIWDKIIIEGWEYEMASELLGLYYPIVQHHYELIRSTVPPGLSVLRIKHFHLQHKDLFIYYSWE